MGKQRHSIFLLAIALLASSRAAAVDQHQCGVAAVVPQELVMHGKPSENGQWPWHGALNHRINRASPTYACGLTVVSKFFTITAAHCTYPETKLRQLTPSELLIFLGISNLDKPGYSLQQFGVKSIVRHESYQTSNVHYDIALLKVTTGIEFNNHVRPICFWSGDASEAMIIGKKGYSPGWGRNEHADLPPELQHAVMPIVSREHCRNSDASFYTNSLFDRMTFCAGSRNGTSVGNGDSGGGLYIQRNGVWLLRGIVSHGKVTRINNLDSSNYVVYTDVAYFLPWIQRTLDIAINDDEFATCGKRNEASPKADSERRLWPWHGQVFRNGSEPELLGNVAIITRSFVLTQSIIFDHLDYKDPLRLLVKFHTTRKNIDKVLHSAQVKVIVPYKTSESPAKGNNVAILELLVPLLFSENLRPICLWQGAASFRMINGATAYIGDLNVNLSQGRSCARQHSKPLDVLDNSICTAITKREYVQLFDNILYMHYKGTWYARGISYGGAKRRNDYSILFLDLTFYTSWISRSIAIRNEMLLPLSGCDARSTQDWNLKLRSQWLFCYGSLVTPYLVLTTATCINDLDPRYPLQLGNGNSYKYVNVTQRHTHPLFHEVHLTNNIGIIQLELPFDAEPICIPKETNITGQEFLFNGWDGQSLVKETLAVTSVTSCAAQWLSLSAYVNTEGGHICGQIPEPAIGFGCQSNLNGSPLTYQTNNRTFLRGILDFGNADHCVANGIPAVFHDLTFYQNWILEVYGKTTQNRVREDVNPLAAYEKSENMDDLFDVSKPQFKLLGNIFMKAIEDPEATKQVDSSLLNFLANVAKELGASKGK